MTRFPQPTPAELAQLAPLVDACENRDETVWAIVQRQQERIAELEFKLELASRGRVTWLFVSVCLAAITGELWITR